MEEATERLVRLFLESKGFLVRTNEKFKADVNKYPEIDIIAIRMKNNENDNIPDRIIGEVKSWSIKKADLLGVKDKFKIFFKYKRETKQHIKNKYGNGFQFVIFSREPSKKNLDTVKQELERNNISFYWLEDIADKIKDYSKERGYTNDPELQILRLMRES